MFLKFCSFVVLLNFVVLATCEESVEISANATVEDTENKVEENINLSSIASFEITASFNESLVNSDSTSNTENVAVSATTVAFNETEVSTNVTDDPLSTTVVDSNYNYDNDTSSTYNVTETTDVDGGETNTTDVTLNITDTTPSNETETTINITASTVNATKPTTVNFTDVTITVTVESTTTEVTQSTTTTTEVPTTPIDSLCPQIPETTIDPKYRNETFELYLKEYLKENPSAKVYKSPGFPAPYAEKLNCTLSITLPDCTGVDVVVHYLDLNPFQVDSLHIRGGEENASNEKGEKLTGRQFNITYKIIHTNTLYIWFESGQYNDEYQGFLLTYSPYGNDTPPTTTIEPPITIPPSLVQVYELQLLVPEKSKTNETWQKFKEVLAISASKFVANLSLNFELAHPDNVSMDIYDCPKSWPNYKDCMRLEFSISLWSLDYDPDVHFDLSILDYELSTNSLSVMWDLYGRDDFLEILGVEEYSIPDGKYILLLWTGISLTIITIFIGILYSIWRIDIFREYRRMHSKHDDLQDILKDKAELDISMYPIPHQPYPTLFETGESNNGGYYDSFEFQGHSFHHQEKANIPSNFRHSTNPFSPGVADFTESQLFPDDEDDFAKGQSLSPRSKHKLLVLGAKRDESNT